MLYIPSLERPSSFCVILSLLGLFILLLEEGLFCIDGGCCKGSYSVNAEV